MAAKQTDLFSNCCRVLVFTIKCNFFPTDNIFYSEIKQPQGTRRQYTHLGPKLHHVVLQKITSVYVTHSLSHSSTSTFTRLLKCHWIAHIKYDSNGTLHIIMEGPSKSNKQEVKQQTSCKNCKQTEVVHFLTIFSSITVKANHIILHV